MTKKRVDIPDEIAAEVLFLSDRTCCKCTTRGKSIQIHHIDENPANNRIENLAVLCLECHNETLIKGGFGRKLDTNQIIKYRDEWYQRVKDRKKRADEIASIRTVTGSTSTMVEPDKFIVPAEEYFTNSNPALLEDYLKEILNVHRAQLVLAKSRWDSGNTAKMNQGNSEMIDFYSEVLAELATFYPKGHFNKQSPNLFFSELISSRFLWHRSVLEPKGGGTGGTVISTMAGGGVIDDLSKMIIDMVNALLFSYDLDKKIDFLNWKNRWLN